MDYKDKIACVVTHGLFAHIAERLGRDFEKVYLCIPYSSHAFPTTSLGLVGTGLTNVVKVESIFGPHFESVDLWVFPDLFFSQEQIYLEGIGKRVFGNRNAEELELYRDICKNVMAELSLPLQPWKKLVGMTALRAHLKENENQFVKLNVWRGNFETFKSESYDLSVVKLDEIETKLGAFKELAEFVCENELQDCVEIGIDTYTADGQLPSKTLVGIEAKDCGFAAEFMEWSKIPEPIRRWHEDMAPVFAQYGARGFISNEIRIDEDHKPYCIDPTMRAPSPPNELFSEFYTNYSEILWNAAEGIMVDPVPISKFGVQVIMKSGWASEHFQPINYAPEFEQQIKIYNPTVIDGHRYSVPMDEGMEECGSVIGWGETLEKAIEHMNKALDSVSGFGIKKPTSSIDEITEAMENMADFGLPVFSL